MRISAVWYPITDWHRARAFYGGTLGLEEIHRNDTTGLTAYRTDNGPPLFLVHLPDRAGIAGGAVVTFDRPDFEAFREKLLAAGVKVDGQIQEAPTARIMTFYDPDGNMLEASQRKSK